MSRPTDPLKLIDRALTSAKTAAHACQNETARLHFEFALALLRESWIAESGQKALPPEKVIENVRKGLQLIEQVIKNWQTEETH